METTCSFLSPQVSETATEILLSPPPPPISSLSNVKYLFLFSRGLCAHCLILDSYQRSFQFDLLSLLCLLFSAPFSVTEAQANSACESFHCITLFFLLYQLGDENLIKSLCLLSPVNRSGSQIRECMGTGASLPVAVPWIYSHSRIVPVVGTATSEVLKRVRSNVLTSQGGKCHCAECQALIC